MCNMPRALYVKKSRHICEIIRVTSNANADSVVPSLEQSPNQIGWKRPQIKPNP